MECFEWHEGFQIQNTVALSLETGALALALRSFDFHRQKSLASQELKNCLFKGDVNK